MEKFLNLVEEINSIINSIVWGPLMLAFMIFVGIYFTVKLKFFQLTNIKLWIKNTIGTFNKRPKNKEKISQFQAMTTALGGAIGTGNIVGVATAISLGGPGAILWMWISAFLGMMTLFAENVLGLKYRRKNKKGELVGGPMYYIEYGMKKKWMAILFSIFCILATFGMGNMAQANSISAAVNESFNIPFRISSIFTAFLAGIIIFGGVKRIASFSEKLVPFMAVFYILGGAIVIIMNAKNIPSAFNQIIKGAFSFSCIGAGATGYIMSNAIKYGIARGTFSNEAGLGSSSIIYSVADTKEPVIQGMWGIFQVFFDTIVGCSITALAILTSGAHLQSKDGVSMSAAAFESVFGSFGSAFLSISVVLFSFATIVGWFYYGEKCIEYICGDSLIPLYKAFYIVTILFGSVMNLNLVWSLSDTFNGLMAIPNLIALIYLSKEVVKETDKYKRKIKKFHQNKSFGGKNK